MILRACRDNRVTEKCLRQCRSYTAQVKAYRTKLWAQAPRTASRSLDLAFKEQEDISNPGYRMLDWEQNWPKPSDALRHLFVNKHYSHCLDYFATLREHGPKPDTETYNIFFAIQEAIGTPDLVIEYFYDFSPENPKQVATKPDATTYGFLVKAHCAKGETVDALRAYNACKNAGLKPTVRTSAVLLDHLSASGNKDSALEKYLVNEAKLKQEEELVPDIEFLNTIMHIKGRQNLRAGEEIFRQIVNHPEITPSYNTWTRLIEVYAVHKVVDKMTKTLDTMVVEGLQPNDLIKYIFFQSFINLGDRRLLYAVQRYWPREVFDTDHHIKFFKDWLFAYRNGGGTVPVSDELLNGRDIQALEQTYIEAHWQETGGKQERWKPIFDTYKNIFNYNQVIDSDMEKFSLGVSGDAEIDEEDDDETVSTVHSMGVPPPSEPEDLDDFEEQEAEKAAENPDEEEDSDGIEPTFLLGPDEQPVEPVDEAQEVWEEVNPLLQTPEEPGMGPEKPVEIEDDPLSIFDEDPEQDASDGENDWPVDGTKINVDMSGGRRVTNNFHSLNQKRASYDTQVRPDEQDENFGEDNDFDDDPDSPHESIYMTEDGVIVKRFKVLNHLNSQSVSWCEKLGIDRQPEPDMDDSQYLDLDYVPKSESSDSRVQQVQRGDIEYFQTQLSDLEFDMIQRMNAVRVKMGSVRRDIDAERAELKAKGLKEEDSARLKELRRDYSEAKHGQIDEHQLFRMRTGLANMLDDLKLKRPSLWESLHNQYRADVYGETHHSTNVALDPDPVAVIKTQAKLISEWKKRQRVSDDPTTILGSFGKTGPPTDLKRAAEKWAYARSERLAQYDDPKRRVASLNTFPVEPRYEQPFKKSPMYDDNDEFETPRDDFYGKYEPKKKTGVDDVSHLTPFFTKDRIPSHAQSTRE